LKTAYIPWYLL